MFETLNTHGKKINRTLREKRQAETVIVPGFPIKIRKKPTAHRQWCFLCHQEIEKGDTQFLVPSGLWVTWLPRSKKARAAYIRDGDMGFRHLEITSALKISRAVSYTHLTLPTN